MIIFNRRYYPLHKKILVLAAPSFIALIAEPLLGAVDTAFIGHLGLNELGAMAIITTFLSSLMWLFNFFVSGTTANIAFYYGKNDNPAATRFYIQSQLFAWAVGIILLLIGMALEPYIFDLMGADFNLKTIGHHYYIIRLFGFPFSFSYFVSMGYLRGLQDMKTPMIITILINILNGILDYFLIYGIEDHVNGIGLTGAAIATLLAQIISCISYFYIIKKRYNFNRIILFNTLKKKMYFSKIFRINRHLFFRTFFLLTSFTFATSMASRMGNIILGAHQIAMQIWLFCSFAIDSFAIAGQSLSGQLLGKKYYHLLHQFGILLQYWGILLGVIFSILFFTGEHYILSLFTNDQLVIVSIGKIFPLIILFQPFNGITFILDGVFIGVSDTKFLMLELFIASILVYIPIAYLSMLFNWGITGIWSGLGLFLMVRLILNEYRFLSRGYLKQNRQHP